MNPTSTETDFQQHYQTHLKHLKLKGLHPKTIDAYSRATLLLQDWLGHPDIRHTSWYSRTSASRLEGIWKS